MERHSLLDNAAIEDFMKYYEEDGYLAYEKLSEVAKQILIRELNTVDIKHEIFERGKEGAAGSKAKAPASARRTVIKRQDARGERYKSRDEILSDMHDLGGLRIALYYPNDFKKVESIVKKVFVEVKPPQDWPDKQFGPFRYPTLDEEHIGWSDISGRQSRFPGYFARHYRVRLEDKDIQEPAVKGKTLEIQLMSLLMHAWSKMHHELIYKPRPGLPAADENDERLLDASSGVIIAGEQILRQIQINLDMKKEQARVAFKNEHDFWSYIKEKWAGGKSNTLSKPIQLWVMGLNDYESDYGHALYKGLEVTGFNNPEKVDLVIKHCLDSYGRCAMEPPYVSFVKMLVVSIVDQEDFKVIESGHLQLSRSNTRTPSRSQTLRAARYMALIVCNSLRRYDEDSLSVVWEGRGDYPGPYPSGQEFLAHIHPKNSIDHSFKPRSTTNVYHLCEYLLKWDDPIWKLRCAASRLTFLFTRPCHMDRDDERKGDGIPSHEFSMTICPWGFVHLLDYCEDNQDTPLKESFRILEAAEESGSTVLFKHNDHLPRFSLSYQDARTVYRPRNALNENVGIWTADKMASPGPDVFSGFTLVRDYLDCATSTTCSECVTRID